jgi:glycerate-2-kinase
MPALCRELRAMGRDPVTMLGAHDSAAALELGRRLIRTGPTGTNVNHVFVAIAGV